MLQAEGKFCAVRGRIAPRSDVDVAKEVLVKKSASLKLSVQFEGLLQHSNDRRNPSTHEASSR